MEPHYKSLAVALVPQPRQIPPPPFESGDLQWIFSEVIRHYSYQTFEFLFGGRGAQFTNSDDDLVELRPALLQVRAKMDGVDVLTESLAREKAIRILKIASERLKVETYLQCAIQVIATVPAPDPDPDAKGFIAENLMHDAEQADVLEAGFFGGGVRFLRHPEDGTGEDALIVEPFLEDNTQIFINYQRTRIGASGPLGDLDQVNTWVEEAFDLVAGPAMRLLER
jgi:hypothetical protein